MVVEHLNGRGSQTRLAPTLAHLNDVTNITSLTTDGTLAGQLKIFLLTCQVNNLSRRSIGDYAQKIGAFVSFSYKQGISQPLEVTPNHIRFFLLGIQEHCKAVSVHDYYGTINRFFNWLVDEGVLQQNPMSRMHPPKIPQELIKPLKPQQVEQLLALCGNNFLGSRNRAIILTFLDTGLRLSELTNIRLGDMDLERETIKVMGKGAKERKVRIGKETQKAILKYLLQRRDALPCLWVTEERRPMQFGGVQAMIIRLGKRAGLKNVRCSPHTFRHTFGTQALELGADIREVQSLLGHSTLTMTLRYVATVNSEQAVIRHRQFSPVDRLNLR